MIKYFEFESEIEKVEIILSQLNNKEWKSIHPEHLKLILSGYLQYKDGLLFRNIVLELFKNYNFII